jgi:hypothetical protein
VAYYHASLLGHAREKLRAGAGLVSALAEDNFAAEEHPVFVVFLQFFFDFISAAAIFFRLKSTAGIAGA